MAYWLDDGSDTWPEVIRAGTAAFGLYTRCGAWIARNATDGYIPAELATSYGTREWITKLTDAGLWETVENGYRDVFYLVSKDGTKLNPPAEKVSQRKGQKAERQRRWLEKTRETHKSRVRDTSRDASQDGLGDSPPALPPSKEGQGRAGARATPSPNGRKTKQRDASQDASNPDWRSLPGPGAPRRSPPAAAAGALHLAGLAGGPRCPTHRSQPAHNCSLCPPA